jgi:hypothetical protein
VGAQPVGKGQHLLIEPHQGWKAHEAIAAARGIMAHIIVNPGDIRQSPSIARMVKPMTFNQPAGDRGPSGIELMGAVSRFAQEDDMRIAETVERHREFGCIGVGQRL